MMDHERPLPELPWIRFWNLNGQHGEGPIEEVVTRTCVPMQALLRMLRGWRSNPIQGWYFQPETEWPQDDGYNVGSHCQGRRVPKCFENGSPGRISRPLRQVERPSAIEKALNGEYAELQSLLPGHEKMSLYEVTKGIQDLFPSFTKHHIIQTAAVILDERSESSRVLSTDEEFADAMKYLNLFSKCWLAFSVPETQELDISSFAIEASAARIEIAEENLQKTFDEIDTKQKKFITLPDICMWFATNKEIRHGA
eukprot:TRINITY_DN1648_c4_g1_i1.p1 TRINITY_DN1648_c4_g1~~TRINITY_DN1648_c4_g1_i1.p1  ORF type:complete len:275 (+),score=54.13 TRINITY_DN1648_c4_g1_i1:66-827(+)